MLGPEKNQVVGNSKGVAEAIGKRPKDKGPADDDPAHGPYPSHLDWEKEKEKYFHVGVEAREGEDQAGHENGIREFSPQKERSDDDGGGADQAINQEAEVSPDLFKSVEQPIKENEPEGEPNRAHFRRHEKKGQGPPELSIDKIKRIKDQYLRKERFKKAEYRDNRVHRREKEGQLWNGKKSDSPFQRVQPFGPHDGHHIILPRN